MRLLRVKCMGIPFEKMDKQARVKELWRETNPDRFADKRQGNPTIRQFLDRVERQARPIHKGVTDPDERWAAAIVECPSELDDPKCVLIVVDLSSHYAWTRVLRSRDQTADAFESIIEQARQEGHRLPQVLIADDTAFTSTRFQAVLRRNYITHREQSEDIATLTRFIGVIRRALAVEGDANWAETLQQVVSKHNESPHRKLFETVDKHSPSELPGDAESNDRKRRELRAARGFRVLSKAKRLNRRAYALTWGGLHLIKGFDGNHAQDMQDRWHPMDDVLPASVPTHEIPQTALVPGNAQAADDDIQDDYRTAGLSMDRVSPSASRGRARPRQPEPSAPMPPPTPRDRQLDQTEAADVMGDIDRLVARVSARQAAKGAPIQTVAEANAAVELRRDLFVEKSVTKQRTPGNVQRLERIQADIRSVNARLRAWEQQHPEWRPGG